MVKPLMLLLALSFCCLCVWGNQRVEAKEPAADPLFDMGPILDLPLEPTVIKSQEKEGIVVEWVSFVSMIRDGKPERVEGILAYPKGVKNAPAVFWSQGGMSPAGTYFPELFAKKGYVCLNITLPHAIRDSYHTAFNTEKPQQANLTLLAIDQMRGITYLTQRPEVDPDRIGMGGSSYGGFFASLISAVDPRVKAGFSFFAGGNHALGTNLPQFNRLKTAEDVAVWNRLIDPATRHKAREVPFLWAIAFNDHWFHFPAVLKTYEEAKSPDKRLAIIPHWQHGFPENVDKQLVDFLDTTLTKTRPAYNQPGTIQRDSGDAHLSFTWTWTGDNPVKKAELVASYGENLPWIGWPYRAAFVQEAAIVDGQTATATLALPSNKVGVLVWGNITDANGVVTSTTPLYLSPEQLARYTPTPTNLNCFPDFTLGPAVVGMYAGIAANVGGRQDPEQKLHGTQSLRFEAPADEKRPMPGLTVQPLHHVPGLGHRLMVVAKADAPTRLTVRLTPVRPANWGSEAVQGILKADPALAPMLERWSDPVVPIEQTFDVGTEWQTLTLVAPRPEAPVDGYRLQVEQEKPGRTTFWIDALGFQPVWPE